MQQTLPYWHPDVDWSRENFYIRRLEATPPQRASSIPEKAIPMYGFLYVIEGEILIKAGGEPYLCRAGHFLLLPEDLPFSLDYYDNALAYAGGFVLSALRDVSYRILYSKTPVMHAFWFEDAALAATLIKKADEAFQHGESELFTRIFDLLLYKVNGQENEKIHPLLKQFMDNIFDRTQPLVSVPEYAESLGITPGYLNKLSRKYTLHTAIEWIEIARINRAKALLKDPSLSISEVALAVGIDDPSYFARFFKKQAHIPPSTFRAQYLQHGETNMR